jgi:glycosyltransferase involved in cell wall biosynthesis
LPSHHEGLSNSLLEAMSCGLPIVSTRVSGSEEILSQVDAGELVDVGDINGLAVAIRCLLLDASRRAACGARARAFVNASYSMRSVARAMIQLYERVIHTAGTPGASVGSSSSTDGR